MFILYQFLVHGFRFLFARLRGSLKTHNRSFHDQSKTVKWCCIICDANFLIEHLDVFSLLNPRKILSSVATEREQQKNPTDELNIYELAKQYALTGFLMGVTVENIHADIGEYRAVLKLLIETFGGHEHRMLVYE